MRLTVERGERLDKFLASAIADASRTRLVREIEAGRVSVNGEAQRASFRLSAGDVVELPELEATPAHDLTPADIPLDIVYEDESLLVVNKPRSMATHPSPGLKEPTLVNALLARRHPLSHEAGAFRPGIVHRLDKDTTGLLMVAKSDQVHRILAAEIADKRAERRYVACVVGDVERERFTVDAPIAVDPKNRIRMAVHQNGKQAITHVKRLRRIDAGTLIGARLETGRTHQIRVHLSAVGHPVLGDPFYAPEAYRKLPLQLHSAFLQFTHPVTGERLQFFQKPPSDFIAADLIASQMLEPW